MKPSYEELLQATSRWNFRHKGIPFELCFHSYLPDNTLLPEGIWCYYLLIDSKMYPHRWNDFKPGDKDYPYSSEAVHHEMFDSEITYYEFKEYIDPKHKKCEQLKVGCDYAHLWHSEQGYPDTFDSVRRDAQKTVSLFLAANPDRKVRCYWDGTWDSPDNFIESPHGTYLHKDNIKKANPNWLKETKE